MKKTYQSPEKRMTRECKQKARELLNTGNNRLWLILSISLWIATAGMIYLLGGSLIYAGDASVMTDSPSELSMVLVVAAYALMLVLFVTVLVPMAGGVWLVAGRIYEHQEICGADLFAAFDSGKRYLLCLRLGVLSLLRPLLPLAVTVLTGLVASSLLLEQLQALEATFVLVALSYAGMLIAAPALGFAVYYVCRNASVMCVLIMRGMSHREAKMRVRTLRRDSGCNLLYYRASHLGRTAVSVLTVGVYAVIDSIPHALLCHQFVCDALIAKEKENKK